MLVVKAGEDAKIEFSPQEKMPKKCPKNVQDVSGGAVFSGLSSSFKNKKARKWLKIAIIGF